MNTSQNNCLVDNEDRLSWLIAWCEKQHIKAEQRRAKMEGYCSTAALNAFRKTVLQAEGKKIAYKQLIQEMRALTNSSDPFYEAREIIEQLKDQFDKEHSDLLLKAIRARGNPNLLDLNNFNKERNKGKTQAIERFIEYLGYFEAKELRKEVMRLSSRWPKTTPVKQSSPAKRHPNPLTEK